MDIHRPIPEVKFPSVRDYEIVDNGEELVSLRSEGFHVESQYYRQCIAGSLKDCYARETVVSMLHKAEKLLPPGLRFKIYDAYRPICVQQRLWNYYRREIINKHSGEKLSDEELDRLTGFYVSKPSLDIERPSLHNTGGAVDLTLETYSGYALNMGTLFDDFTDRAYTNHFEKYCDCREVRDNRRLLYNVMTEVGFTNLPSEWWHYGYGTKFWSYFKGKPACYKGILNADLPDRFPLM